MNNNVLQQIGLPSSDAIARRYARIGLAVALCGLIALLLGEMAIPSPAYASPTNRLSVAWSSVEKDATYSVAWGDWDGDGDDDLAVGNACWGGPPVCEPNRVYESEGGDLSLAWSSVEADETYGVAWGDWDGDGDDDLAVGNWGQPNRVYESEGGSLSLAWSSTITEGTYSVAWGDWDGDGDLDLAVGNAPMWDGSQFTGGENRVYENEGDSLSLAWTSAETDGTWSVAWGDWDGDGDLDLAAGNMYQPDRVYENSGGGLSLAWSSPEPTWTASLAWGDWDGDGDDDLAVGRYDGPKQVYENQAGSLVLAWSSTETDNTNSVAWGDWDRDGDLDLAVGNYDEPHRVYENVGDSLSLAWSSFETGHTWSVAWGDWDADGDLDLAVGNAPDCSQCGGGENRVYENDATSANPDDSAMVLAWSSTEANNSTSLAWGDWNGDGDLDLAVGNWGMIPGLPLRVYDNSGGSLAMAWFSEELDAARTLAWGDWDADGDLDLAIAYADWEFPYFGGPLRVYENVGGSLSPAWTSAEPSNIRSLAWGDWDADGDLDLALGTTCRYNPCFSQPNQVYENEGGSLSLAWSSPEADATYSVAWGDWDGDDDLDLAVGNGCDDYADGNCQPNRVYENVGGDLSLAWSSTEVNNTRSLAWGDWDGDGDLDLAVGSTDVPDRVYQNTGDTLALAWSSADVHDTRSVAWGDWDLDGDLDLAAGARVYENSGGHLSLAWPSSEIDLTPSVAWGDWDRDGDLDLAVAGTTNRVYENVGKRLSLAWSSMMPADTMSVAWRDWDGDGDDDLAVGNACDPNPFLCQRSQVYESQGGRLQVAWSSVETNNTRSLAWGDWDGDGDDDLAVGNAPLWTGSQYVGGGNRVYENVGGSLQLAWSATVTDSTYSVAWGDWDGDGDDDLAVGNQGQPNRVYESKGGSLSLAWSSPETDNTYSVAWADWDGDGDDDLAVGNAIQPNRVYESDGGSLSLAWSSPESGNTHSLAWGDWDGDGDPDLAVGNYGTQPSRVYQNEGGSLSLAWSAPATDSTNSVAWADWDGDGDLDLAAGNYNWSGQANKVYENVGGSLEQAWSSAKLDPTRSVAWGDWDGDGDPDLAVGNNGSGSNTPNRVYENDGGSLSLAWASPEWNDTSDVAWGDWDRDGDLDVAVANYAQPMRIFESEGNSLEAAWWPLETDATSGAAWGDWDGDGDLDLAAAGTPMRVYENLRDSLQLGWSSAAEEGANDVAWGDWDGDGDLDLAAAGQPVRVFGNVGGSFDIAWTSPEAESATSVAWGDWDRDGDLDLATGGAPARVFENIGGSLSPAWSSVGQAASSVAWGDWDGDGDLDLAAAGERSRVYENVGGSLSLAWTTAELDTSSSVAWGDWDGDGDLDLAVGNLPATGWILVPRPNWVYENVGGSLQLAWSSEEADHTTSVAWGDWDGDGDLDLVAGNACDYYGSNYCHPNRVYMNHAQDTPPAADSPSWARITTPGGAAAPLFASATVLEGPTLPITYTLFDGEGDSARLVRAWYSLDGGSHWQPAAAASGTITANLAASPAGTVHTYTWDIYGNEILGANDSVVFKLDVYQGFGGSGPFQYPFRSARTLPFRVRGSQVRVVTAATGAGVGAWVYRLPAGQTGSYDLYRDGRGRPFRTNAGGYLPGYGELGIGDSLVAVLPITNTESYTLCYTNATPTATGVEAHSVVSPGVQTLVVSADHPLVLFNLDVSLQWDARNDSRFLVPFEFNLQRASELLYDWTDGQAALGRVTIYHNRAHWNEAHVRVYASNRRRPSAVQGGIVPDVITETNVITDSYGITLTNLVTMTYAPGQTHMGAVWNRYGEPGGDLGEDWARTLAHELGHYAFFLDDSYLGFDRNGQVIPVDTCPGAMADPYRQDYPYDEFHADDLAWQQTCTRTLSHQLTGRPDWATVETFYPWLSGVLDNHGPSRLPMAVTWLTYVEPDQPPGALTDPTYYLKEAGARVQPGNGTRAFLYQDGWALDLGQPVLDHVLARGARPGDEVCVYEPAAQRLGCETVNVADEELEMGTRPGWQPDIAVTPVNSVTMSIEVSNVPPDVTGMEAQLYPMTGPATGTLSLVSTGEGYSGTFYLAEPTFEGAVRVWVTEAAPRREIITDYAVGGNPVALRGSRVALRGSRVALRGSRAPVLSADGQVILFVDATSLGPDEFYTLQAVTAISPTLPWATVVGQAYRLSASEQAPGLAEATINFSYMAGDVPEGGELWLRLYYWDGQDWQPLPSTLDTYYNSVSAPVQGEGLYALMASVEVPLYGPGWNLFGYPMPGTRPITDALASLDGFFTTVYDWDATAPDPYDRWRIYDVTWDPAYNSLHALAFGDVYWITVTQDVTLYLRAGGESLLPKRSLLIPPATFYGAVLPGPGLAPTADMEVTARAGSTLCGRGETLSLDGQIVYRISVLADEPGYTAGCGEPGHEISFYVDGVPMAPNGVWDNDQVWEHALAPGHAPASLHLGGPEQGILGTAYLFTATVTPVTTTTPIVYRWEASAQDPVTHTGGLSDTAGFAWSVASSQTITVTATNLWGTGSGTHAIVIHTPVRAGFAAWPTVGVAPLTVAFTNTTTGDYTDSLWQFGDGVTTTLDSPTHTYVIAGIYTVTLSTSGPGGTDTEVKSCYIAVLRRYKLYLPLVMRGY